MCSIRLGRNCVLSSESFKTELMECTCKLRRRKARKPFFPSLGGAAVSLKHVVPRVCLKCPGSVTELLFRWHHGKR